MLSIRPIAEPDIEPLRMIFNATIEAGDVFTHERPFDSESMRRHIDSYTAGGFVATLDGRVVGGYVLRPDQPGRGSHVCNATYVVDVTARGHGVGRRLGEHSLVTARDLGFTAMRFNAVVSTNTAAVALWQSLGFSILASVPDAFRRRDASRVALHVMYRAL